MFIVDRDIYLVLLGGAIGFFSSVGGAITKYLLDFRLARVNSERERIMKEAAETRKKLLGDDDPVLKRKILYGR